MYRNLSSDEHVTMAASQAFEGIINQVVASKLNFCLEQSPFSAVIHLKKSVIRNKSGIFQIPPPSLSVQLLQVQSDNFRQAQKIVQLESVIKTLKSERAQSEKCKKDLENKLGVESSNNIVEGLETDTKALKKELDEKSEECETVKNEKKNLKTELNKISAELYDTKIELQKQHAISQEISIKNKELKTFSTSLY